MVVEIAQHIRVSIDDGYVVRLAGEIIGDRYADLTGP
jgi:hypothetical protein